MPHAIPPWRDGDCRDRDISPQDKKIREDRFAQPIWANAKELQLEEQRRLEEEQFEQELQDVEYMALYQHTFPDIAIPDIPVSEIYKREEHAAVAALIERNDRQPLASLLDPHRPFDHQPRDAVWMHLSKETRRLMAEVITGRFKHEGGRPKKGQEKNSDTPSARDRKAIHDAAAIVPFLRKALRAAYPKPRRGEIGKRALYMASREFGVEEEAIRRCRLRPLSHRLQTVVVN
jgi:hypothetical protein